MRIRKVFLSVCCFVFMVASTPTYIRAETGGEAIVLKLQDVKAMVKGNTYELQSAPVLVNDITMVPLRFVGEALGANIGWNGDTRTVTLTTSTRTVILSINSKDAVVGEQPVTMDQPAIIMNDTTMVPLRFVAEQLGQTVTYNNQLQTITLTNNFANVTPVERTRLSPPTVDNLVPDPDGGQIVARATQVLSVVVDKNGYIYSLRNYANNDGYIVSKYEPEANRTSTIFRIDAKLNFEYEKVSAYSYFPAPVPRKNTFIYASYQPNQLYYNPLLDSVYVLGLGGVVYSLEPEVKMETHNFTFLKPVPWDVNSGQSGAGIAMFETLDGEKFYWGSGRAIYSSLKGGGTQFETKTYIEPNSQLDSVVKDNTIYTYDMSTGYISTLGNAGLQIADQAFVDGAVNCIGANGKFIVMTAEQIYQVTVDGQITLLINRNELKFNKGLYNAKSKSYEPMVNVYDPSELKFNKFIRFALDPDENIILYDENSRMVRRINVYEQE
ncbi:hypothetical protein GC096_24825 [Paenibacillus sp. LMG 31461]|uniref:Copper amine oxidase-like N-terminal domain-containing protein n=1 Tax=Paenibacillus plantarum TaxID=2654975 RepID=A0ABX1XFJ7_9BACL|nr:copper amine oxidase N-terminal domain-containing protein [Paenibacillus plantarum]NOU67272.1 hypothetical protein [Paenibacillus plantarum]